MKRHLRFCIPSCCLLLALLALNPSHGDEPALAKDSVKIGMVKTIFRDVPPVLVQAMTLPFSALMYAQTGVDGNIEIVPDALELGKQLNDGKVQLGVFHGVEFAWARTKYPNLKPLMMAINRHHHLSANLVTRNDNPASSFSDLKGSHFGMPRRSREHCHVFLDRFCDAAGCKAESYFSKVSTPANIEAALDDVVRGTMQAVIVDNISLENYQDLKPGCYNRLKIIKESEPFPPAVIVYNEGGVDAQTLAKFRKGMLSAAKDKGSRNLMMMLNITAFEAIPEEYHTNVANILKAYPSPESRSKTMPTVINMNMTMMEK